ncbi:hypothetical protein QBC35DRAFT_270653 [Podospora australis]|uniref:Uncharacterized protein n=1 Tax=Podospora australis TaxID=1536484 RepID=A0AAN7AHQ3_9PEZI|nr:hypothetical protein QBC35DRAFT_270653 [Podospora australis]
MEQLLECSMAVVVALLLVGMHKRYPTFPFLFSFLFSFFFLFFFFSSRHGVVFKASRKKEKKKKKSQRNIFQFLISYLPICRSRLTCLLLFAIPVRRGEEALVFVGTFLAGEIRYLTNRPQTDATTGKRGVVGSSRFSTYTRDGPSISL